MSIHKEVLYFIGAWNAFVFLLYGFDKLLAILKVRRIREVWLLIVAFLMGGVGAMLGMLVFFHKIRKWKFLLLVPIAAIVTTLVTGYSIYYIL